MKCEKCGKEIDHALVNMFLCNGSDTYIKVPISEVNGNAVIMDVDQNWTGYGLIEEDQMETISCPCCKQFPFKHKEVQVYDIVRIVCFKSAEKALGGAEDGSSKDE